MNKVKEIKTGLDWCWIAKTPNGKYITDFEVADLKSHRFNKFKKEKDQDTINNILYVSSTGKEDKESYNNFINLLKNKKGFSDKQIQKLDISCISLKNLKNIQEQKQLRLDIDDVTSNLACNILYYFEQQGNFLVRYSIDTINVYDNQTEEQICEILFWNKKYSIFIPESEYYYIGRTLEDFEKDFEDIYQKYKCDAFWDAIDNTEYLIEDNKKINNFKIIWVDNLEDANKLCPKEYWKYFDDSTVPKFLTDKDVPGKKYGFVIDAEKRPLAGIAAYFNGKEDNDYKDETLPYLWELGAVSNSLKDKQEACPWAQKGTGTALVKDFAKKVNYKFWFKTASDSADAYWQHVASNGDLGKEIKPYYLGDSKWGDSEYSTVKPNKSLINIERKKDEKGNIIKDYNWDINEECLGANFAKMSPSNNLIIQKQPFYKKLNKTQAKKYKNKRLNENPEKIKEQKQNIKNLIDKLEEDITNQAYRVAKRKHNDTRAVRKYSGLPYIVHPMSVADITRAYGGTNEEIAAAYLHDTVEDTGAKLDDIEEKFGPEVAQIVSDITNDPYEIRKIGKEEYINRELQLLPNNSLFVKLADIYANLTDYPSQDQKDRMIRNVATLLNSERSETLDDRCLDLIDACIETAA